MRKRIFFSVIPGIQIVFLFAGIGSIYNSPHLVQCQIKSEQTDRCEEAKAGSDSATAFSKSVSYDLAKKEIQQAAAIDSKEHTVSFGKDAGGNIIVSDVNTGSNYSSSIPSVSNCFADMHNHPGNGPPFSHDIYGLIDIAASNPSYLRFVVIQNETVYALIVTDIDAAKEFNSNYPRQTPVSGFEYRFPDAIVDEMREIEFLANGKEAVALALILKKYNVGIALLQQNADGNFRRVNAVESKGEFGEKIYVANYCK